MQVERNIESARLAGYTRVSTAAQAEEGFSLDEQARQIEGHASREGMELVTIYREEGVSGRTRNRPALQRMLADAQAGRFDRLIVPAIDRLGRSTRDTLTTLDELETAHVTVVFLRENIDMATATGRFVRTMLAGLAEMEAENIGARVKDSIVARAREGRGHGGAPGFGYQYVGHGVCEIVPEEAVIVQRIYREHNDGRSIRDIAKELATTTGREWGPSHISKMLRRRLYLGGPHTPQIIDCDTWERAAAIRASRDTGGSRGRTPRGEHLLTRGRLKCTCGPSMAARTWPDLQLYVCMRNATYGKGTCPQPNLRREDVDGAIRAYFAEYVLDPEGTRQQIVAARQARDAEHGALRVAAEADVAKVATHIERVEADYLNGDLKAADYSRLHKRLEREHGAALDRMAVLSEHEEPLDVAEDKILNLVADIKAAETVPALRVALAATFESFTVTPLWTGADVPPVHLDLAIGDYALVPKIRAEAIAGYVTTTGEVAVTIPQPKRDSLYLNLVSGGTSRYCNANLAISAKAGAATAPPQIVPLGSSTVTSTTRRGFPAGTYPTKEAT
jgi:DNA invertase Pin-like site-specific DNA recombinase